MKTKRSSASAFARWKNTSEFPDSWAKPVCEWIAQRFALRNVSLTIRNTSKRGHGRAWYWDRRALCSISRRRWRRDWTYATIGWAKKYEVASALEAFVFLAAHELHHLSRESQDWRDAKRDSRDRLARQSFEQATDRRAWEVVLVYREERVKFLKLHAKRLRRERERRAGDRAKRSQRKTPEAKLARLESHLLRWERRLVQAHRRVKHYRTKINRTRASLARFNPATRASAAEPKGDQR